MAYTRSVATDFWSDPQVVDDFTPEDRYFYLYLLTNPHGNLCGCYQISKRQAACELGYDATTVGKLIARMHKELDVCRYDERTGELLILKWHRNVFSRSPQLLKAIEKQIACVKSRDFKLYLKAIYKEYAKGEAGNPDAVDYDALIEWAREREAEKAAAAETAKDPDGAPKPAEDRPLGGANGRTPNEAPTGHAYHMDRVSDRVSIPYTDGMDRVSDRVSIGYTDPMDRVSDRVSIGYTDPMDRVSDRVSIGYTDGMDTLSEEPKELNDNVNKAFSGHNNGKNTDGPRAGARDLNNNINKNNNINNNININNNYSSSSSSFSLLRNEDPRNEDLTETEKTGNRKTNDVDDPSHFNADPFSLYGYGADGTAQTARPRAKEAEEALRDLPEEIRPALKEWIEYKKDVGQPLVMSQTRHLLRLYEEAVKKHGYDRVAEVIGRCICAGYKGIVWDFLERDKERGQGQAARGYGNGGRQKPPTGAFGDFQQREYDWKDVTAKLLAKSLQDDEPKRQEPRPEEGAHGSADGKAPDAAPGEAAKAQAAARMKELAATAMRASGEGRGRTPPAGKAR